MADESMELNSSAPASPKVRNKANRGRRKGGGRAARRADRESGADGMAVRPGMKGGQYKPLSDHDIGGSAVGCGRGW